MQMIRIFLFSSIILFSYFSFGDLAGDHSESQKVNMKNVSDSSTDLKSLGVAIQSRLKVLTLSERARIPKQYQENLLIFIDGLTEKSLSVGGWYLDQFPNPEIVTRWLVVNDQLRVSAQFKVVRSYEKWSLQDLQFGLVHTSVVH